MNKVSKTLMAKVIAALRRLGPLSAPELAAEIGYCYASASQAMRDLEVSGLVRAISRDEVIASGRHASTKVSGLSAQADVLAALSDEEPPQHGQPADEEAVFESLMDAPRPSLMADISTAAGISRLRVHAALKSMAARGEVESIDPLDAAHPIQRDDVTEPAWALVWCRPVTALQAARQTTPTTPDKAQP